MEAKCPKCEDIAELDQSMNYIRCKCGYVATYDEYIEDMKNRITDLYNRFIERI